MTQSKGKGRPPHQDILTPAEWRVVNLAQHGLTNPQIANSLDVSVNAVKYHISNAVSKLAQNADSGVVDKKSLLQFLGAPKDSAFNNRPNRNNQMKSKTTIDSVGQISRTVNDIKKSEAWYRETLGIKHLYSFGQLAFFELDGVRLFLTEKEGGSINAPTESIIYFKTNDIQSTHAHLKEKGIEFTHAPHKVHTHEDGTEEWMAFFSDLENRPLGLMGQYK